MNKMLNVWTLCINLRFTRSQGVETFNCRIKITSQYHISQGAVGFCIYISMYIYITLKHSVLRKAQWLHVFVCFRLSRLIYIYITIRIYYCLDY